jgi:hypothetical protein
MSKKGGFFLEIAQKNMAIWLIKKVKRFIYACN